MNPISTKTAPLTEAEQTRRGDLIAKTLNLKEARCGNGYGRGKPYDPPRYFTQWGTKSALGLFLSVERLVRDGE